MSDLPPPTQTATAAPTPPLGDPQPAPERRRVARRAVLGMAALGVTAFAAGAAGGFLAADLGAAPRVVADWTAADIQDQRGRRFVVTGGNGFPHDGRSGLGYQIALALARAGGDVCIASRDADRGAEAVRRIVAQAPGASIRFERLDLADLGSIAAFADRMAASGQGIDGLINNAGVMGRAIREISADGFERVFATNTLGHFALTVRLLPLLRLRPEPRIVWVTSLRTSDALPFDDLQAERSYDYALAYDRSKLANLLLAFETDRRSRAGGWGVASLAAHPGVARTNLIPDGPGLDSAEGWRFRRLPFLFQPSEQGALPTLFAATAPEALAGGYYGPNRLQGLRGLPAPARPPAAATDRQTAARLWTSLESLAQTRSG